MQMQARNGSSAPHTATHSSMWAESRADLATHVRTIPDVDLPLGAVSPAQPKTFIAAPTTESDKWEDGVGRKEKKRPDPT
jgi:hypothetical protein